MKTGYEQIREEFGEGVEVANATISIACHVLLALVDGLRITDDQRQELIDGIKRQLRKRFTEDTDGIPDTSNP